MRVTITDSSVVHIETSDGISINMFVETASILFKTLKPILQATGHLECAPESAELAATDTQHPRTAICLMIAEDIMNYLSSSGVANVSASPIAMRDNIFKIVDGKLAVTR